MSRALIHPSFGSARINAKGYPRLNGGPRRNQYLHRAVFEEVAGRPVRPGFHIHHMNGKLCWCPHQLVEIQAVLHPAETLRHPFTGRFMKPDEYRREFDKAAYWRGEPYRAPIVDYGSEVLS